MKKRIMILMALLLLICCGSVVNAEDHEHIWSVWDYYKTDTNYHYGQRHCYDCGKTETITEAHDLMPNPSMYSYGGENICNAEYRCKICYEYIKKPTQHNWIEQIGPWKKMSDEYHQRNTYRRCSQCGTAETNLDVEKHNLGFHEITFKGKQAILWGCNICGYAYGNKVQYKTISKTYKTDRKHYHKLTIPLLHNDVVKSTKVMVGNGKAKFKKISANKFKITPKKKGRFTLRITTQSGVIYTITYKIK